MQGVRWTEEDLAAHRAKMAGHKAATAVSARPANATGIHKGPLPGSPGDEGMGGETVAADRSPRFAPHAERRMQKQTSRTPSAPFTAKAERSTGTGGDRQGETLVGRRTGDKPKLKRPEQTLQIEAVKFLHLALPPTWRVVHVANGVAGADEAARRANVFRKAMGVRAGFPDLSLFGPGRYVVAEAKAGKGRLRPEQVEWRDWFQSIGVPWFVFRDHDELVAGCLDAGVPLRVRV